MHQYRASQDGHAVARGDARDAAAPSPASRHVGYLDLFRGLTILQIVMIHAGNAFIFRGLGIRLETSPFATANYILFHGATIYFAVISGILYGHRFWQRDPVSYWTARAINVGLPYVVVTCALTTLLGLVGWSRGGQPPDWAGLGEWLMRNLLMGDAWNTLWYIPVILVLYALSPLLWAAVRAPGGRYVALLLIALPLVFSRTGTDFSVSTVIYFAGAYTVGMLIGCDLEAALDRIADNAVVIAAIAAVSTAALVLSYLEGISHLGPVSVRESLFYLQKLSLAALTLIAVRAWQRRPGPVRDAVLGAAASAAFGLYFLHGPAIRLVAMQVGPLVPDTRPWWALTAGFAVTFAGGLALSWGLIVLARLLLGQRSRLVIGA